MAVLVRRKGVQVVPIIAPEVVDQAVAVFIDSIESIDGLTCLDMDGAYQVGMQQGHPGIDHPDDKSGLRLIKEVRLRPADVETGGAGLPVDDLSCVAERPLLRVFRIQRIEFAHMVRFGGLHDGLLGQLAGKLHRSGRGGVVGIGIDAKKFDMLGQPKPFARLEFGDIRLRRVGVVLDQHHTRTKVSGEGCDDRAKIEEKAA